MSLVGGADEAVVSDVQAVPHLFNLCGDAVDILLGADALRARDFLDFLAMFIRSRQEIYVIPHHAFVARDHVGENHVVGVSDMRLAGRVRNGGGDVKLWFVHAGPSFNLPCDGYISYILPDSAKNTTVFCGFHLPKLDKYRANPYS